MKRKLAIFIGLLSLTAAENLFADNWFFPTKRGRLALSENGKFAAYVTPAKGKEEPLLEVFEISGSKEVALWHCRLGNAVAPLEVYITDNGRYVVTVNDPPRVGYGKYVLAFYSIKGRIKNYSLEQILHSLKVDPANFNDVVPMSILSRWWDRYSIKFLDTYTGATYFCIWFDLLDRWVAWDPANGRRVEVTQTMIQKWNNRSRLWAIRTIEEGSFSLRHGPYGEETPYVFLSKLRNPQDRNIIESLLSDETFYLQTRSSKRGLLHYIQASGMRSLGEKLLAKWDGRPAQSSDPNDEDQQIYYHLGIVDGTIRLPHVPKVGDGTIWVYLVPAATPMDQWYEKPPVHRLAASFDEFLISEYGPKVSQDFLFGIEGVTPGKYRLKAVWDKATPHCEEYAETCLPQPGDYESIKSLIITVKAGETVENVIVDCTHEVAGGTD